MQPRRFRSLRVRLAVWYAGAVALAVLVYAVGVYVFVSRGLQEQLDRALHDDFEAVEQALDRGRIEAIADHAVTHADGGALASARTVEVWTATGALRVRSPGSGHSSAPAAPDTEYRYASDVTSTGLPIRTLVGTHTFAGQAMIVRVTRSEAEVRHELRELLAGLAMGLPLAVVLAGACGYQLARRALRPVDRMASEAASITADRLRARLAVENPDDELGRLAAVFNEMLQRLEEAFDQLKRFTADASHELRTPLTAIRSVGEVGLREPRDASTYREIIGSMLEETDRLTGLVDGLLFLSRADSGRTVVRSTRLPLRALVDDVAAHLAVLADERGQRLLVDGASSVAAYADPVLIRPALINIVDNAIKYSPNGAEIVLRVTQGSTDVAIEVIDQGPGIALEHQARVFERFYRVDAGRSREQGGTGLGLAIGRWAVDACGGTLELESEEGRGCLLRIRLPGATADAGNVPAGQPVLAS